MKKMKAIAFLAISFSFLSLAGAQTGQQKSLDREGVMTAKIIEALGKIGDVRAYDICLKSLKSDNLFVHNAAIRSLAALNNKNAVPVLLKELVNEKDTLSKILITSALIDLGMTEHEKSLIQFSKSSFAYVRALALEQLARLDVKYLPMIADALAVEKDNIAKVKLIEILGNYGFRPVAATIRKELNNANEQVRTAASFTMGEIGDPKDIALLVKMLDDKSNQVRAAIKTALSKLGDRTVINVAWKDLEKTDPLLKASSYVILANSNESKILPDLIKEVVDFKNASILRVEAARSLRILRPYFNKLLIENKSTGTADNKIISTDNLGFNYRINGENLVVFLSRALTDRKNPLYGDVPLIFLALRDDSSLPVLRQLLFSRDLDIAATAAYALGEMRDTDSIGYLISLYNQYNPA
ncbi:HEAT repeat domain-containing protein [bacterium]|nr:MAG: HEAT repeat domain-containing protein [bacterium]